MIDDTLYLKSAAQILRDPLRPYDFSINWYGWEETFWNLFKNPPGVPYWLAGVQALGGTSERALHLSLLPFAIAAVLGGGRLARRFAGGPPWPTALWAASPAFLVSASTLMADVPSLALALWGLALWIEGVDRESSRRRWIGAGLAGAAVVVKYTSVLGVVVLAFYALSRPAPARRARWLVDLVPALLPSAAWASLTLATHDRIHVLDALAVGGGGLDAPPDWFPHRGIAILTFIAASAVFPVALSVVTVRGRMRPALVALTVGIVAALAVPWLWPLRELRPGHVTIFGWGVAGAWLYQPLVALLAAAGAFVLLVALADGTRGLRGRDRDATFLAAWIALHVVYLWLWSWTIAARFVLPALVPIALLLARATGERPAQALTTTARRTFAATALVTLAVGAVVLRADGFAGDFHRRVVPAIAAQARAEGRRALFLGGWGFQHYAEQAGMRRIATRSPEIAPGDIVIQPYYVANNRVPAPLAGRLERVGNQAGPMPTLGLHTMNPQAGAGFYSSLYGPLPFFPARLPGDGVAIFVLRPP